MPAIENLRKWAPGIFFLGLVIVLSGCENLIKPAKVSKANNLHDVDCKKHDANYPGQTEILVNAESGIAPEDEVIFVCKGEQLHWKAGAGVQALEVSFLNNEWPFKQPFEAKLSGNSKDPTPDREVGVLPANFRAKTYKYKIHVVTGSGVIDLDPHIIPMGG